MQDAHGNEEELCDEPMASDSEIKETEAPQVFPSAASTNSSASTSPLASTNSSVSAAVSVSSTMSSVAAAEPVLDLTSSPPKKKKKKKTIKLPHRSCSAQTFDKYYANTGKIDVSMLHKARGIVIFRVGLNAKAVGRDNYADVAKNTTASLQVKSNSRTTSSGWM